MYMKPTAYDDTTKSSTQPRKDMTIMGTADISNLIMIITWVMNISSRSYKLEWGSIWMRTTSTPGDWLYNNTTNQKFVNILPLHWRHNDHDSVSNHQPHGCLLNRLFRRRSKKTSKFRVTGLCVGNSPGPVNSPHKGPVTRKMFPLDDVIMTESV